MLSHCCNALARARPALVVFFLLVTGTPAAAHAVLLSTVPSAGARVEPSPQAVTLTFGEAVETSLGSVRVLDVAGADHATGPVTHPDGDANRIRVELANMTQGRYVVAWQVVSADSHLVNGAYAFGVGVAAGAPPAVQADDGATLFLPILHFAVLAGALLGIGLPIGAALIGRRPLPPPSFVEFGAWFVLAFAAFADVAFRADLAGGTLAAALTTRTGVLRMITVAAAIIGALSLIGRRRRWFLVVPAAFGTLLSLSLAGHASDGAWPIAGVTADGLHLLAAATWIGVLAVGTTLEDAPELRGISRVATVAVLVLVASGIVQTVRDAGSWGALLSTTYGQIIDFKIALLLILLGLAIVARRILARGSLAIGGLIKAELWVLTVVVVCTAVLVESPLPRDAAPVRQVSTTFTVRDIAVRATATAIDDRHWKVRMDAGAPLDDASLSAAEIRRHVGPLDIPLSHPAPGTFTGTVTLPLAGEWQLLASARSGQFDEAHATLTLPETSP
jgi:copper transport protein